MELWTLLLISVGLAADAVAVSLTAGTLVPHMQFRHAVRIAVFFGGFQLLMPLVGWLLGASFKQYIENYDHWVAFGLLIVVGGKMAYEAFFGDEEEKCFDPLNLKVLLTLAVATSIDALAVGFSLSLVGSSLFLSVVVIGVITFLLSLAAVHLGRAVGHLLGRWVELAGGLILILIGSRILWEHLSV